MKKIIIAFMAMLTILSFSKSVYAAEYSENWINCRSHIYDTLDNPWDTEGTQAYLLHDTNPGIIIRVHNDPVNNPWNNYTYYYFSFYNTATYCQINTSYQEPNLQPSMSLVTSSSPKPSGWNSLFTFDRPLYYLSFTHNNGQNGKFDIECSDAQDLYNTLNEMNWDTSSLDPNAPDANNLPMLQYGLTKKTVVGFPQITQIKEILTWDYTSQEIYKNNPTDFHMEMLASARFTPAPTGIGNIRDTSDNTINENLKVYITNGGCNITANQYSFIYREIGKSLYAIAGENWDDNSGYFMYVRTVQDSTGKASAWKVYNLAMNGLVVQEDTYIEPDGTQKPLPNNQKDIGNGQGVQPAKFDNDNSTSADSDPTSVRYDPDGNFNVGTVVSTLKSLANSLSELPTIAITLAGFLPNWLMQLIALSIGLMVSIGLVKSILK